MKKKRERERELRGVRGYVHIAEEAVTWDRSGGIVYFEKFRNFPNTLAAAAEGKRLQRQR